MIPEVDPTLFVSLPISLHMRTKSFLNIYSHFFREVLEVLLVVVVVVEKHSHQKSQILGLAKLLGLVELLSCRGSVPFASPCLNFDGFISF